MKFNWLSLIKPIQSHFRNNRLKYFVKAYPDLENLSVLDVGGNYKLWELLDHNFNLAPKELLLLNNASWEQYENYAHVIGDARNLEYEDKSFDLVFSNSVIEHVGGDEDRFKFAQECLRVGKEVYIQTPNHWFPIEPHIVAFLIHWFPKKIYKKLSFLSIYHIFKLINFKNQEGSDTVDTVEDRINTTNLLKKHEFERLFENTNITSEKVLGMEKSFVASTRKL